MYPLNTDIQRRSDKWLAKWNNEKPKILGGESISRAFHHTSGLANKDAKGKLVRTLARQYGRVDRIQDYNEYECYQFSELKASECNSIGSIVLCPTLVVIFLPLMEWPSD